MGTSFRGWLTLGLLAVLSLLLSGCFLRALTGNITGEGDEAVGYIGATSITADCRDFPGELPNSRFINCFYFIDDQDNPFNWELHTTFGLIAEYGLFGVLIDPLILQVPEGVHSVSGTFSDGADVRPLEITITDAFDVAPGLTVTAEPGQQFVILEFPGGTEYEDVEFDFELEFLYPEVEPVPVKPMFTGRVDHGGHNFYIPLLPCTTEFADVPEFTIPVADEPEDLLPGLLDFALGSENLGCQNRVYDFRGALPPLTQGDNDCDGNVNAVDALKTLQHTAAIEYSQEPGCPPIGTPKWAEPHPFFGDPHIFGDTDCDGGVGAVDALQVLRFVAALPVHQQPDCVDIGDPLN